MNTRGDKLISVYWFTILILVAGGISAMVYIFYSAPYDVREMEGAIMINQVADCISQKGKINEKIFEEDFQNNFLEKCHLNFNAEDDWEELQYYLDVKIYGIDDLENPIINLSEGNLNWISSCEIANDNYEKLAKCVEGRFYVLGDKQYLVEILSIIRKSEKNVKQ